MPDESDDAVTSEERRNLRSSVLVSARARSVQGFKILATSIFGRVIVTGWLGNNNTVSYNIIRGGIRSSIDCRNCLDTRFDIFVCHLPNCSNVVDYLASMA